MDIKIITIHNIPNFGSVFQAYALRKYIESVGYNAEVIDYNPSYFLPHTFRSLIAMILNLKPYITRKKKFDSFVTENIQLTKEKYKDKNDFLKNPISADIFIAGGDQLWNTYHDCGNDDVYKLAFTNSCKISYATSMGRKAFSEAELQKLRNELSGFSFVSVRELSSVALLKSVGIEAIQCVDPVLLLKKEDYLPFIKKPDIERYLLVYLVTPSALLDSAIKYISESLGLKVVLCSGFSKKCICDVFLKDLGPDEILSYIAHADFVLSASFHATLFSIIFQRQFATILPDENTNERIEDLLSWNNLTDRIVKDSESLSADILADILYDENQTVILDEKICESKNLLLKTLNTISDENAGV